jgi:anti-sigma factor RsiW
MHDSHDLDLIADYADGSRDPAAERLLDSCAECRAELALHQEMRGLLAGAPSASMTDAERATLRAGVRAGIDEAAPVVSLDARRQSRWLKLGSVAAAMFVTVGVAGILTQQRGNDTSATFEAAAGSEESATEEAFTLDAATDTTAAASMGEFAAEDRSTETGSQTESTTAADSPPVGGADAAAIGVGILTDAGPITRVELDGQVDALIDLVANQPAPEQLDTAWFNDREIPAPSCLTSEALPVFGVINAIIDDAAVQAFVVFDAAISEYRSDIFLVDGCTPIE